MGGDGGADGRVVASMAAGISSNEERGQGRREGKYAQQSTSRRPTHGYLPRPPSTRASHHRISHTGRVSSYLCRPGWMDVGRVLEKSTAPLPPPNSEPAASPSTFSRLASTAPSLWAQMPSSGPSLGWAPTPACELVTFAWLLPPCCCPRWVRTRGEPTSPAPRPASPPLLMSAFF